MDTLQVQCLHFVGQRHHSLPSFPFSMLEDLEMRGTEEGSKTLEHTLLWLYQNFVPPLSPSEKMILDLKTNTTKKSLWALRSPEGLL